jgi:hypothetical protein
MREVAVASVPLRLEAGEAGGRYLAPILILPGLFQSWACWRGMTSMLAHRGWNVYLLPRASDVPSADAGADYGWEAALTTAAAVARGLGDKIVVFGADVGASLALSLLDRLHPLALGLFAPVEPGQAARAFERSLGMLARRRARKQTSPVAAPAALAKRVHRVTDASVEPQRFMQDLIGGVAFSAPAEHPPAIVFAPEEDPLVAREQALAFTHTPYAKLAPTRLYGRWWPSSRWEPIADEVHRFLILTLADRVVEFPEEIIED